MLIVILKGLNVYSNPEEIKCLKRLNAYNNPEGIKCL